MKIYNLILLMVDIDDDGRPDENIIEITEWKPGKNVDNDPSVKGQYNPATSMGGANTGDNTCILLYIGICISTLGFILYLTSKRNRT